MRVAVEVCAVSVPQVKAALEAGADTIELCVSLEVGGLTPNAGLIKRCLSIAGDRLRVLVRPRPGSFVYSAEELDIMQSDLGMLEEWGGRRLVIGAIDRAGGIDRSAMEVLMASQLETEWTFHRAFDSLHDQSIGLEACISIGFHRILTSGGGANASEGAERLRVLLAAAEGRVRIAAGGGIGPGNVVALVERTGVAEVHFSAQRLFNQRHGNPLGLSGSFGADYEPDVEKITGVIDALSRAGLR